MTDPSGLDPTTQPTFTVSGGLNVGIPDNQIPGVGSVSVQISENMITNTVEVSSGDNLKDWGGITHCSSLPKAKCSSHWLSMDYATSVQV